AGFTVYSLAALPSVRFDYNRLHLQARGTESAIWEQRIVASRRSGFAALTTAESAADLRAKQAAFERLPAVAEVTSLLTVIPADQETKLPIIRDIAAATAAIRVGAAADVDVGALRGSLAALQARLE